MRSCVSMGDGMSLRMGGGGASMPGRRSPRAERPGRSILLAAAMSGNKSLLAAVMSIVGMVRENGNTVVDETGSASGSAVNDWRRLEGRWVSMPWATSAVCMPRPRRLTGGREKGTSSCRGGASEESCSSEDESHGVLVCSLGR